MSNTASLSRQPHDELSSASVEKLRHALRAHLSLSAPHGTLRPALQTICVEARQRKIAPERLLVLIKEMWNVIPEVQNLPRGAERDRLLDRVITISIEEFFGRA